MSSGGGGPPQAKSAAAVKTKSALKVRARSAAAVKAYLEPPEAPSNVFHKNLHQKMFAMTSLLC